MAPKHKLHETKPKSKCKQLASPSTAIPSPVHSQRKCKKELLFRDDDDDTPIAHLVHKSSPALTPKTSKSYRANIVVLDNTGRATLTLFDQAAEELFNTSSDDINRFKNEDAGYSSIASILHEVMNKQFLLYIKVTSMNYHYISTMYSSGYTAELAEWIPKVYKPHSLHHPLLSPSLPSPSTLQPSHRGVRGEEEAGAQVTYERRKQLANLRVKAYKVAEEKLGPHLDILDPLKY